ncbi:MAG: hypothetical protein AAF561_03305 [Planctomycetota bacterium]
MLAGTGAIAGTVGGQMIANSVERVFSKDAQSPDRLNHDVELLVGRALEGVFLELEDAKSPHAKVYKTSRKHDVAETWRTMLMRGDFDADDMPAPDVEALLVAAASAKEELRRFEMPMASVPVPTCLTEKIWRRWIIHLSNAFPLRFTELGDKAVLDELAPAIVNRFYWHLFEVLKADFADDGRAYAAIQMSSTASILALVRDHDGKLDAIADKLDEIERLAGQKAERVADRLDKKTRGWFKENFHHLHSHLAAVEQRLGEKIDRVADEVRRIGKPRDRTTRTFNLPPLTTKYVPRDDLLDQLHAKLAVADAGLVQAVAEGDGGYGKTLLALGYAHDERYLSHYPGGRYFISLSESSVDVALATLARQIGLPDLPPKTADAANVARDHLAALDQPALLVVDNVESRHFEDRPLGQQLPGGVVRRLYTTRQRGFLSDSECVAVDKLTSEQAVALLAKFRPDAADPQNRDAVIRIYTALEGIAVGIASVAAFLGHRKRHSYTFATYADRLESKAPADYPDADPAVREQTGYGGRLVTALNDAFETQSPLARFALHLASVMPQDAVPRPWLVKIIEAAVEAKFIEYETEDGSEETPAGAVLAELVYFDFLRPLDGSEHLLTMHRVHGTNIRHQLKKSPDLETSILTRVLTQAGNGGVRLLTATAWLQPHNRWEVEPLLSMAEDVDEQDEFGTDSPLSMGARSLVLSTAGDLAFARGERERGRRLFDASLSTDRRIVERFGETPEALRDVSVSLGKVGDVDLAEHGPGAARPSYVNMLEMDRRIVELFGETPEALRDVSVSLGKVGNVDLAEYGPAAARPSYAEALKFARRLLESFGETPESLRDVSVLLNKVGDLDLDEQGPSAARTSYAESLEFARRLLESLGETPEALRDVSVSLSKVGNVDLAEYGPAAARPSYAEALEFARRLLESFGETPESLRDVSVLLNKVGDLDLDEQGPAAARPSYTESLKFARRVVELFGETPESSRDVCSSLERVGDVDFDERGPSAARASYTESLKLRRRIVERFGETPKALRDVCTSLERVGNVEQNLDDPAARDRFEEALSIYKTLIERHGPMPEILLAIWVPITRLAIFDVENGKLNAARGRIEQGLDLLRQVETRYGLIPKVAERIEQANKLLAILDGKASES